MVLNHVQKPRWQMMNLHDVSITALIDGHSFNSNDPVEKHCDLIFNAKTDALKPFSVYWQVVNTGQEARDANCLRGDIMLAKSAGVGGLVRKESTFYSGSHWIQCFIVKDNKCTAKSNKFIVKIK